MLSNHAQTGTIAEVAVPAGSRVPARNRKLSLLAGVLALAGAGLLPVVPTHAAGVPSCAGIRPTIYEGSTPTFIRAGHTVTMHGSGFLHYQNPVIIVQDALGPGRNLRIAATVESDGELTFTYPANQAPSTPSTFKAYVEDDGSQRYATEDQPRSPNGITLNVIPPAMPVGRVANVKIDNAPNMASPFCSAQPVVTEVAAFVDRGRESEATDFRKVSFSTDPMPNASINPDGDSEEYVKAHLIVVARFQSCAHDASQFVAAHFAMYGPVDAPMIEPIGMMAGDGFDTLQLAGGSLEGVMMKGDIQHQNVRLASATTVEGTVTGLVTQGADSTLRGATLRFNFQVPVVRLR